MKHLMTRSIAATMALSVCVPVRGETPPFGMLFLEAGGGPVAIETGDFNNDGAPDLVTTHDFEEFKGFSLYLGRGDGTFEPRRFLSTGEAPEYVVAGDFDGDGADTLFSLAPGEPLSGTTHALYGLDAEGAFVPLRTITVFVDDERGPSFSEASPATVGDFNGDGRDDLALMLHDRRTMRVYLGREDGGFDGASGYVPDAISRDLTSVAVYDLDDDLQDDLVVAHDEDVHGWSHGAGELFSLEFQNEVKQVLPGSFDAYPGSDLLCAGEPEFPFVFYTVVSGVLGGSRGGAIGIDDELLGQRVATFDVDADGLDDLLGIGRRRPAFPGSGGEPMNVSRLELNAGARFIPAGESPRLGPLPVDVAAADFNGDGRLDLAAINNSLRKGVVTVLLGDGYGGFGGVSAAPNTSTYELLFGRFSDVDLDGFPEIVSQSGGHRNVQGRFDLLRRPDLGVARAARAESEPRGFLGIPVAELDLNGDGLLDRVLEDLTPHAGSGDHLFDSVIRTELQLPGGGFVAGQTFATAGERGVHLAFNSRDAVVVDLNDDRIDDLIIDYWAGGTPTARAVVHYAGAGVGELKPGQGIVAVTNAERLWAGLSVADVDLDGDPDLFVGNEVLVQTVPIDTSSLINGVFYNRTYGPKASCLGDVNADGRVGPADLARLMTFWGFTGGLFGAYDLTGDSVIDAADIALLLAGWGDCE